MEGNRHLDDFVRKKIHERQYAYDDAYWAETAAFLDAHQRPKKTRWFFWFVFLLLGSVTSMASIWWYQDVYHTDTPPGQNLTLIVQDTNCVEEPYSESLAQTAGIGKDLNTEVNPRAVKALTDDVLRTNVLVPESDVSPILPESIIDSKYTASVMSSDTTQHTDPSLRRASFSLKSLLFSQNPGLEAPIRAGSVDIQGQGFPQHRHHVGLMVGIQRAPAWAPNEAGVVPEDVTPTIGLTYQYNLSPRFTLSSGIQYWQRTGLDLDTLIVQQAFGQGLDERRFDLRPRRMHALKVPLILSMRFGRKSQIRAGGYISRLLDVESQLMETTYQPSTGYLSRQTTAWGYRRGIQTWQYGLSAAYGHYLGRGITADFEMGWSWQDLTDDVYFRENRKDRQLYIQLSFSKSLFTF
ncbi:MAG: hypothetical protein AAFW00_23310 [Bacteroidota bacterium]